MYQRVIPYEAQKRSLALDISIFDDFYYKKIDIYSSQWLICTNMLVPPVCLKLHHKIKRIITLSYHIQLYQVHNQGNLICQKHTPFGALTSCCFYADPFEHVYVFDSESDLLVPQLMSQLVMGPEFHNDLVYDCIDICEICICLLNA